MYQAYANFDYKLLNQHTLSDDIQY